MHSFALINAQVTHRGRKKSAHSGLALGFGWCIFKMMWTCAGCPLHVSRESTAELSAHCCYHFFKCITFYMKSLERI